jgi:hypothetical protein
MKQRPLCTRTEREISALADLPRPDLVGRWQKLFGGPPPKGLSRRLLVLALTHRMQAKRYGDLKPAIRRRLLLGSDGHGNPAAGTPTTGTLVTPGTRLLREWNGITHVVDALDVGFLWLDTRYGSLSAVARAITGARWSGPRFFGLTEDQHP